MQALRTTIENRLFPQMQSSVPIEILHTEVNHQDALFEEPTRECNQNIRQKNVISNIYDRREISVYFQFEESQESSYCNKMDDISSFSSWNTADDSKTPAINCKSCKLTCFAMKVEQKFAADEVREFQTRQFGSIENGPDSEDHNDSDEEEHPATECSNRYRRDQF